MSGAYIVRMNKGFICTILNSPRRKYILIIQDKAYYIMLHEKQFSDWYPKISIFSDNHYDIGRGMMAFYVVSGYFCCKMIF